MQMLNQLKLFSIKGRFKNPFERKLLHSASKLQSSAIHSSKSSPLSGIRILDLTRILAGPFCTMLLGDLGAEVIKVEKPVSGDETRLWSPPLSSTGLSCYFLSVNRNKKSIGIDIDKGRELVRSLAAKSDILIENFIPGTLDKYSLGYEDLVKCNSSLIYCSISGYGPTGPYAKRGGYDVIAASIGGLLNITGTSNGEPCKVGVAMTDIATGLYAHGALMAALIQREKTGLGQKIEANLLSTQVSCLVNLASNYLNGGGVEARRWGTAHESIVPYEAFMTKDQKWITVGAGSNALFDEFCKAIGLQHLLNDKRYETNACRVENRVILLNEIRNKFKEKSSHEWLNIFRDCKFPYGPINDMEHVFKDPQVEHSKIVQNLGPYRIVGPAVSYSDSLNCPRSEPPSLGQHTYEVLENILYLSKSQIDKLYSESIVY